MIRRRGAHVARLRPGIRGWGVAAGVAVLAAGTLGPAAASGATTARSASSGPSGGAPVGGTTTSTTTTTTTTTATTGAPTTTGTPARPAQPISVRRASLAQDGTDLVWSLRTATAFSPNQLNPDRQSICLLIERPAGGTVVGEVCVQHPGDRRHPSLVYRRVTRTGPVGGHVIAATVTRTDATEMTARFLPADVGVGYRDLGWQVFSSVHMSPCTIRPTSRLGCGTRFPSKMQKTAMHSPIPSGCQVAGPAFVTNGSRRIGKVVALTFDDGPWPDTPQFLDVLEREHVVATFFQIGNQVSTYGRAVDMRMLRDGDVIGDHTWDHADVAGGGAFAASEITSARSAIQRLTGFTPCLFRAPYGAVSSNLISTARDLNFTTIQWDVDPTDWARPGTDAIYSRVVGGVEPGSIVLQHDGGGPRGETLAALPREIDTLKARGYRFVTVPQLLGLRLIYR